MLDGSDHDGGNPMNRSTAARIGVAGLVAGAGLTAGGVAIASADDAASTAKAAHDRHPGGPLGDRGVLAKTLADELGLKQATVEKALRAVAKDLRPDRPARGEKPTPPTDAEREQREAALAKALAEELDVSQAKVEAALEKARQQAESEREDRRADVRKALVERLDAAVEDGTLTKADKASVLKAFDADLLGAGPGPGGPGPGGPKADSES
jgi:DNA-binding MarR family transcriptional regulator